MSRLSVAMRDAALGYATRGIPVLPLHYPSPPRRPPAPHRRPTTGAFHGVDQLLVSGSGLRPTR
jgi:hypothetical protein